MKFCKNLQQVIDISDPAWAPFWLNYKGLKKMLKDLPTFADAARVYEGLDSESSSIDESTSSIRHQQGGDRTTEKYSAKRNHEEMSSHSPEPQHVASSSTTSLGQCPGEVAFFKYLHSELQKVTFFFEETTKEYKIREQRLRRGMEIIKAQSRSMVDDRWGTMSRAMYTLYRDLLLLETFAIMTYVGFSKILKKHDKVTGYRTCTAYMESIVNKANFTHYPEVMAIISRVQSLHEDVSKRLEHEGKKALSEDEQLFISMIQRVNEEVLGDNDVASAALRPNPNKQIPREEESKEVGDLRELLAEETGIEPDLENESESPVNKVARC